MAGREKNQKNSEAEKILVLKGRDVSSPQGFCLLRGGIAFLVFALGLWGCGGHPAYDQLGHHLSQGDCSAAALLIDASVHDYPNNSTLLYLLDSAMVNMHCRAYGTAQQKFRAAEGLSQELWTTSLSREAASFVTNDYVLEYKGEDYERAMIHMMSALAYADAGRPEEALVECRRLDSLLNLFNDKYEKKNRYKEDAFARYFSGILREGEGDISGAFIDYKKAVSAYDDFYQAYGVSMPDQLKTDLFRAAFRTGRLAEAHGLFPDVQASPPAEMIQERGEVVWVQLRGRVPEKREDRIHIYTKYGPVTIAFPRYEPPGRPMPGQTVLLRSQTRKRVLTRLELASDLGTIAVKDLEDRLVRIRAKALARAAAKQALIQSAAKDQKKEVKQAVRTALNLINALVEQADLRSWQTLPGQIYMGRTPVSPGLWEAEYDLFGHKTHKKILVKPGQIHYIVINDSLGEHFHD